jgi:hypothetical protein
MTYSLLDTLTNDALIAVAYFEHDKHVIGLPWMHSFPKNCCEVATKLFARSISKKYVDCQVYVVKAYDSENNDWHYWTEVDGTVVDLTAHQFLEYDGPLVKCMPSLLEKKFHELEKFKVGEISLSIPNVKHSAFELAAMNLYKALID